MFTKWLLTVTTILMIANAAEDYSDKQYVGMSLAIATAAFSLMALVNEIRHSSKA